MLLDFQKYKKNAHAREQWKNNKKMSDLYKVEAPVGTKDLFLHE